jgi:hypothetical protein
MSSLFLARDIERVGGRRTFGVREGRARRSGEVWGWEERARERDGEGNGDRRKMRYDSKVTV